MKERVRSCKWRFLRPGKKIFAATLSPRLKSERRPPFFALEQGLVKQRGLAMTFTKSTKVAVTFASLVAACAMLPSQASAGLFDIFKARPTANANSSGKQLIAFQSKAEPGTIIVSFADRRLYYVLPNNRAISYPIAGPKDGAEWAGEMTVTEKRVNPDWTPTADMRRANPTLPAYVPGGHRLNPLGVRALYLGSSTYRIHGTDAPWTIGQPASSGCVRMFNNDVIDLYSRTKIGTRVIVTWQSYA
jgi:lipoprotein-anchoring transpeptidase ErfK/SrfK